MESTAKPSYIQVTKRNQDSTSRSSKSATTAKSIISRHCTTPASKSSLPLIKSMQTAQEVSMKRQGNRHQLPSSTSPGVCTIPASVAEAGVNANRLSAARDTHRGTTIKQHQLAEDPNTENPDTRHTQDRGPSLNSKQLPSSPFLRTNAHKLEQAGYTENLFFFLAGKGNRGFFFFISP
ncbi:hypothetical protein Nepgr_021676 [Nepenthes gracilis]|uniref:Uncharacterized protein n=1 Tax=Nepenthes gracilis TaxID=150966 RepID=A0AAD3SXW6_NEPGR|nr:hypothetical protein Nepgr_021676 [Nepenthes gracilis]